MQVAFGYGGKLREFAYAVLAIERVGGFATPVALYHQIDMVQDGVKLRIVLFVFLCHAIPSFPFQKEVCRCLILRCAWHSAE